MRLLSLQNNQVTITPEALQISAFKKLWDRDKSRAKEKALLDLAYVYYFADFSSVYSQLSKEDRARALTADIYEGKKEPDKAVNEAVEYYEEMQGKMSPSLSFLEAALFAANKIKGYFYSVDFTLLDTNGKPVYDISKINTTLKDIGKTIDGLDQLKERVMRELQSDSKIRGGVEKSLFEDPEDEY